MLLCSIITFSYMNEVLLIYTHFSEKTWCDVIVDSCLIETS
jgi:hypothetical protein